MFISILCDNLRNCLNSSNSVHKVYETFIDHRLSRDENNNSNKYKCTSIEINKISQIIAFYAFNNNLGYNPKLSQLREINLKDYNFHFSRLNSIVDALVSSKLGYIIVDEANEQYFSFSHRRLHDYFSTSFIIDLLDFGFDINNINFEIMLSSYYWQETVISLLQTQRDENLKGVLNTIERLIKNEFAEIEVNFSLDYDIFYSNSKIATWLNLFEKPSTENCIVVR